MADFYKLEIANWNEGTANLSLELEAAYLRVINAIRLADQPITMNTFVLCGLWRCNDRKAKRILAELIEAGKVYVENGKLINQKAVDAASALNRLRTGRASAGHRGGVESANMRAKPLKTNNPPENLLQPEKRREEVEKIEEERPYGLFSSGADFCAPPDDFSEAVREYNTAAKAAGWPVVKLLSKSRRAAFNARFRECGGMDGWRDAIAKARASPHCCGQNARGWTANFDFITRQKTFARLMEGDYDDRRSGATGTPGSAPRSGMVDAFATVAAARSGRA